MSSSSGTIIRLNETRKTDPNIAGIIKTTKNITSTGVFGQCKTTSMVVDSSVLYTDYSSIQLRYSCSNVDNFLFSSKYEYYFILVRKKTFDSITELLPAVQLLKLLGINLNDMVLMNNNNCFN